MRPVFADSFYFLALFIKSDKAHAQAAEFAAVGVPVITTAWVLTEVGDAFCAPENRNLFLLLPDTIVSG